MATDILRFAILGLGAGAAYGITALGVVLVYRGSGVLNFAHGAIGMVGAFVFYNTREGGSPTWICWVAALALGAAFGAVMHIVIMRPLRHAPPISRLIATLGVFTLILTWGTIEYGLDLPRIVGPLLPVDGVEVLPDISIGENRVILLAVAVVITVVLSVVYRYTKFGLSTTAVASSRRITAAQGISPDVVATANWMLGCMLAVVGAVLIVSIAGLTVAGLALLIVPALAAALLGSFRSFTITMLGGLLIGILESEVQWLQTYLTEQRGHPVALQGWTESVPFLVIILVLVLRGRALPLRSEAVERPPEVGSGHIRVPLAGIVIAGSAVLIAAALSNSLVEAVITSAALAIVLLSAVVVTGYAGQLSLAQFALAGMGAWIGASLVANQGASFELATLCGVAGAVPIGIVVGLPSLRTRGVNLAVATLGLALVIQSLILGNADRTGGLTGLATGPPRFFGIDFDPVKYPERYALLSFGCFVVLAIAVANLRRGRAGRRLIAVRSNERAAAALGISVFGAKLYAFGLSAGIAAIGGLLIVFRRPIAVFLPVFSVFQSIIAIVYVVVGGVGFVLGPVISATTAPGGFFIVLFQPVIDFLNDDATVVLIIAASLLVVLWLNPNGVAPFYVRLYHLILRRTRWVADRVVPRTSGRWQAWTAARRARTLDDVTTTDVETPTVVPATLEIESLGVRYGGVVALDDVSLVVHPGEIVGLIGPNGAGKTTLIDAVTGFARATGSTRLDTRSLSRRSARARNRAGLGRSFQSLELFETMTVRENLQTASDARDRWSYFTDLFWPARPRLGPYARAAVREFGLVDDLDRRPDELPFGRRRLVAIARAVAAGPSVLMLDEPAAGLDDRETAELGRLVGRLAREWGMGVLIVEHDVELVLGTCDRVCVLDSGRHLATGTPEEIRRDPAVVAAYLGEPAEPAAATPEPIEPAAVEPALGEQALAEPALAEPALAEPAQAAPDATPEPVRVPVAASAGNGASGPLLAARGLNAGYGDLAAVRGLDLTVEAGEVVALIGPNGAGKTTTLLTLAGELPPLGGEVLWEGRAVTARNAPLHRRARQGLAFVPEERAVIPVLSTGANLRLGRGPVEDAVAFFPELERLMRRRAGLLSGGEQQMLSLGRALASKPRVLLIDELSLGLAPMLVARLLAAVRAAADRDGVGVVLVEQHAVEALAHADRVVVLRRGHVEMAGRASELRERLSALESAYLTDVSTGDVTSDEVAAGDVSAGDVPVS